MSGYTVKYFQLCGSDKDSYIVFRRLLKCPYFTRRASDLFQILW